MIKEVKLFFEEKDFKKLENLKEEKKILGRCDNWADFILKLARIRK